MRELFQHRILHAFRGGEYAFALPSGDHAALEEIVGWCCDIWNGGNSLVIPVAEDGAIPTWIERMLANRDVDLCIAHERVDETAMATLLNRFGPNRLIRHWSRLLEQDLHPLNLQPSFLLPPERQPRRPLPIPVYEQEAEQRVARVVWGRIDDDDMEHYREAFYLEGHLHEAAHFALTAAQVEAISPLAQSVYLMKLIEQQSPDPSRQIFVFDDDDFDNLVFFWNLRSRAVPIAEPVWLGLPISAFQAPERLRSIVDWVGDSRFHAVKPDIFAVVSEQAESTVKSCLQELGFQAAADSQVHEFWGEVPEDRRALEFAINRQPSIGGPLQRGIGVDDLVLLGQGLNHLRLEPSPEFRFRNGGYAWLDLRDIPSPFPWTDVAAAKVMHNLRGEGRTLTFKTSPAQRSINIDLSLPTTDAALADYLQARELTASVSRAGRWAQGLLARLESLSALAALATEEAVQILDGLTPLSRKKAAQRIGAALREQLAEGAPADQEVEGLLQEHVILLELRARRLAEIASEVNRSPRDLLPTMEALISRGFAYRGYMPTCPNCGYEQFRSFDTLAERIECAACRISFLLPISDQPGREPPWVYQLDGLMARVMDQDLLPVLLAVRVLFPPGVPALVGGFWPGIEVQGSGFKREADLLLAIERNITVVECKRRADSLTLEEVERTAELAERLQGRLALAALDGEFSDEVTAYAGERGARLLSRKDLIAEPPVEA